MWAELGTDKNHVIDSTFTNVDVKPGMVGELRIRLLVDLSVGSDRSGRVEARWLTLWGATLPGETGAWRLNSAGAYRCGDRARTVADAGMLRLGGC